MTQGDEQEVMHREWDGYDAYLFDIDGTLLNCTDAVHYLAFCEALSGLAGRPLNLEGVTANGNTDVGILRDAFALAGVADDVWRPRLEETCAFMCRFVDERKRELCTQVLPHVRVVLGHLRAKGAVLGVATGNLERIGRLKLGSCGLLEHFQFGGYSDQHEYRRDVFASAIGRARVLAGPGASICAVGDTPEDVRAARANGIDIIAVATGSYNFEQLMTEGPDWCVRSLDELLMCAR